MTYTQGMAITQNTDRARQLATRYNREADEIDRLEVRLYRLREKHRETYNAAMGALPDGTQMEHDTGRIEVVTGP